jgi:hypothetical protein
MDERLDQRFQALAKQVELPVDAPDAHHQSFPEQRQLESE